MTFEEYLKKRATIDQYISEVLKDDKSDDFAYQVTLKTREDDTSDCRTTSLYKKYSNVERSMQEDKGFCEVTNFEDTNIHDYIWWNVEKYVLEDGEYQKYLACSLSADGELIHFFVYPGYLEEFLNDKDTADVQCCRNVEVPYQTGDILRIKRKPMGKDFYVIYCYDETKTGNKHLQMSLKNEISFCEFNWLYKTEKVETSPDDEINEMSKRIKENPSLFKNLIEKYGVSPF